MNLIPTTELSEKDIDISNASILIVDDTPANIDVLWKTLETEGYNISGAPNGKIALELAPETQPCLILLDVMMPDMDGYEVCRRLKANPLTERIPVIFITAKSEPGDIVQGFRVGGNDYITKPFYQEEVKSRINTHLRLRKLLNEKKKLITELSETNQLLLEKEAKMRKMAYRDGLTDLANRLAFNDFLEQQIEEGHEFILFYIDMDKFKAVNDTYGHHTGDMVLKTIATRLRDSSENDNIIARLGGDEFAMIIKRNISDDELQYFVEQLLIEIKQPIDYESQLIYPEASIGIIRYPEDALSSELLMRHADASMYCAKRSDGSHYCTFSDAQDQTLDKSMTFINAVSLNSND